jgi:hypothetical protein
LVGFTFERFIYEAAPEETAEALMFADLPPSAARFSSVVSSFLSVLLNCLPP